MWRSSITSAPGNQRRGASLRPGAAGAAYPVDEVFRHLRQIVVDDVGDVVHVQAARGDVGSDQYLVTAVLKAG